MVRYELYYITYVNANANYILYFSECQQFHYNYTVVSLTLVVFSDEVIYSFFPAFDNHVYSSK